MTFDTAFQSALRTQGLILSDDEIKRAEFVARSVAVAMLRDAVEACKKTDVWGGYHAVKKSHIDAIRAIIQQVLGTSPAVVCPYCSSENAAIRETYFDQCCAGCVRRMCE